MIRIPNAGEFFLDIETLVAEERVVVYKALDVVKNLNIVLSNESTELAEIDSSSSDTAFDIFMCMLQGGSAKYKGSVVRLLVPAVDSKDLVVIVEKGLFKLVNIKDLEHLNKLTDLNDKTPSTNLLPNKSSNLPTPKNKYSDRFDLRFDD